MSEEMTPIAEEPAGEEALARELVERARTEGAQLVGPGGLSSDLTKTVLETALEVELEDHLGYARHGPEGSNRGLLAQRLACEDGADRGRRGRDRRPARS